MTPTRLSIVTYNIWLTKRWPERAPALERFLKLFSPDVLCVQELQKTTQGFLDTVLEDHARVHGELPGWTNEGNIYWRKQFFDLAEYGAEEVGHLEADRRLFWARLKVKATNKTIFVSTAHLTSPRNEEESQTGHSPRVKQLRNIAKELTRLVGATEPAFFMGDMNDARHPQRVLKTAGYTTCFAALGMQSPPTFACYPTSNIDPEDPVSNEAIDLIVANRHARAMAAGVPQVFHGDIAPSDHWPVQAVYEVSA